jgi:hypothetical protein
VAFAILLLPRTSLTWIQDHRDFRLRFDAASEYRRYVKPLQGPEVGVWVGLAPAFYLTALVVALAQVSLIFAKLVTTLITTERS